jgi:hypothetical protein
VGQAQYCRYEYSDGGKPCKSSDECLGQCIIESPIKGQTPIVGICKYSNRPFGCYAPIEHPELYHCAD